MILAYNNIVLKKKGTNSKPNKESLLIAYLYNNNYYNKIILLKNKIFFGILKNYQKSPDSYNLALLEKTLGNQIRRYQNNNN